MAGAEAEVAPGLLEALRVLVSVLVGAVLVVSPAAVEALEVIGVSDGLWGDENDGVAGGDYSETGILVSIPSWQAVTVFEMVGGLGHLQ